MMFEVLILSKETTILNVLRCKKKTNQCENNIFGIPLLHVSDPMDELR